MKKNDKFNIKNLIPESNDKFNIKTIIMKSINNFISV